MDGTRKAPYSDKTSVSSSMIGVWKGKNARAGMTGECGSDTKSSCRQLLWLLGMVLFSLPLSAFSGEVSAGIPSSTPVLVAGSSNHAFNARFISLLQDRLGSTAEILEYSHERGNAQPQTLVIAIGAHALSKVQQRQPQPPTLALMVTEEQFAGYVGRAGPPLSAVFHNPPMLRQALLGHIILPQSSRIALLVPPGQEILFEELINDLKVYDIDARLFFVTGHDSLIETLSRALSYGDFLLAQPDDTIFNSRTIKHILLTAYRHNRIVIGPNRAFVAAGSLASTYTPITAVLDETHRHILHFQKTGGLPEPAHPGEFLVEINEQVARSLNIPLPEHQHIRSKLTRLLKQVRAENQETEQEEPL